MHHDANAPSSDIKIIMAPSVKMTRKMSLFAAESTFDISDTFRTKTSAQVLVLFIVSSNRQWMLAFSLDKSLLLKFTSSFWSTTFCSWQMLNSSLCWFLAPRFLFLVQCWPNPTGIQQGFPRQQQYLQSYQQGGTIQDVKKYYG